MSLSDNLRALRKQKGYSQEQLAERLNVSRQAVSKWESDNGYPEMLFVFKGSPIFIINDEQFQFHPGDVILLNSNDKHEIISQEEASIFLCLQILPKYFEGYFPQISHVVFTDHCRYDIKHNLLIYTSPSFKKV